MLSSLHPAATTTQRLLVLSHGHRVADNVPCDHWLFQETESGERIAVESLDWWTPDLVGERVALARAASRPFAVALLDGPDQECVDWPATVARLLDADTDLQLIIYLNTPTSSEQLERNFPGNDRIVIGRQPIIESELRWLVRSLLAKWRRLQERDVECTQARDLTMFALAQLADSRDPETGEHLKRMRSYAQILANYLSQHGPYQEQIDATFLADFYRSTPLHDIGKVGIPDQILLKPGRLSRAEFDIMKYHTTIGAETLEKTARRSAQGHFLTMAASIARNHHERWDGRGYPLGLQGEAIPLSARITALADVYDALTSARVYKEPMAPEEARRLIQQESGAQFDPAVVEAFLACFDRFLEVPAQADVS